MTSLVWVIGSRGLLGSAIVSAVEDRPGWAVLDVPSLPWTDDARMVAAVNRATNLLLDQSRISQSRWAIVWAAGAVVTSSSAEQIERELEQFRLIVSSIASTVAATGGQQSGAFFYASSAGGIYAGSPEPPFSELTEPHPLSGYGQFKLDAEQVMTRVLAPARISTLAGRISNIYGPGQRLTKMQGLISHIAKAQFGTQPASIFVPLETSRDYIYVRDCAELILDGLDRTLILSDAGTTVHTMKNLVSGQSVTISTLLGLFRSISKNHPHVMLGYSAAGALQAVDLRLKSVVWTDLDERNLTPLPVGIRNTMQDILFRLQAAN
ncbi:MULTISPECIES: NAD-dependent epimerase/dehydratase family protein [unclassified Cryobacterium]|uniref:NAD-dependent epimerase/dehydratase family protein n=1 Tax=unclassified Cryobacterium TaxID=2649013 RepID=UPI00106D82DF|nr:MULTISPECIES: NAD-dependent epimerase/dehydratase family protein [unclassified Cryobacterium]TFD09628.1 NAD-dependent epimerase/dehydratase family protein [Cryobacterium sp. TMT1-2-2]TFD10275.1 NAD-dependent epimerase/dehydratase family protein [Cryobacterium sp. TMT1-66-1]